MKPGDDSPIYDDVTYICDNEIDQRAGLFDKVAYAALSHES